MHARAKQLIRSLKLTPHPEDGFDTKSDAVSFGRRRVAIGTLSYSAEQTHQFHSPGTKALRAFDLIEAILRDPFKGIGKPEPLKYLGSGVWSRRLTQGHRLV